VELSNNPAGRTDQLFSASRTACCGPSPAASKEARATIRNAYATAGSRLTALSQPAVGIAHGTAASYYLDGLLRTCGQAAQRRGREAPIRAHVRRTASCGGAGEPAATGCRSPWPGVGRVYLGSDVAACAGLSRDRSLRS